ncbi:hypothetical protein Trydic_g14283 [Trypoxylus dichotomus]
MDIKAVLKLTAPQYAGGCKHADIFLRELASPGSGWGTALEVVAMVKSPRRLIFTAEEGKTGACRREYALESDAVT